MMLLALPLPRISTLRKASHVNALLPLFTGRSRARAVEKLDYSRRKSRWESVRELLTPAKSLTPWPLILIASLGGALTIAVLALVGDSTGRTVLIAALGSSCVLVFLMPDAPLSKPINVVGGHVSAALCGVVIHLLLPTAWWSLALSVGLAMAVMAALRVIHPPAGGTPIAILLSHEGWGYLFTPVLEGALILTVCAVLYRIVLHQLRARSK